MSSGRHIEQLTLAFYAWERQGRGWRSYPHTVPLEPAFRPFTRGGVAQKSGHDDGRRHTWLSQLIERFTQIPSPATNPTLDDDDAQYAPEPFEPDGDFRELEIFVPSEARFDLASMGGWLSSLVTCTHHLAFELIGNAGAVRLQVAVSTQDWGIIQSQLNAFFPEAIVRTPDEDLATRWRRCAGEGLATLEFGLAREFMLPLRLGRGGPDSLTPIVGALSRIGPGELGLIQVLFQPVRRPWAEGVQRSVTTPDGQPFFADAPEVTSLAREKIAEPLYAVVLRLATKAIEEDRAWDLVRSIAGGLGQFGSPQSNELVPLAVETPDELAEDILNRTTHRSGMIWSAAELVSLVHLPGPSLQAPALQRSVALSRPLPVEVQGTIGVIVGQAVNDDASTPVRLHVETRLKHLHLIGASGTGKSTLLVNLILQDIEDGEGVGVIDPHGDLADEVLARIPNHRRDDVIIIDPADEDYVVGWNILGAHSATEKEILGSDLVALFRRLSTSWGDQMTVVLAHSVMAFLESRQGGTLQDLRRFLVDSEFREAFLQTVADDHVVSFWQKEFPLLIGRKPQAPILSRLDTFLRSRLVREVVTERTKPLDFRQLIDTGKILVARLSQGAIGEENTALLGGLLVSKLHQVCLNRQDVAASERRPFFLYVDEFQQVATPSMAGLFSGVRKYHLGLTVAHQDLYQLHEKVLEVERAVLTNAYTRICFRVGEDDARRLERGYAHFTADDLLNLGTGEALCRVGRNEADFSLHTSRPLPISASEAHARRRSLRERSGERYGRRRTVVAPDAPAPVAACSLTVEPTTASKRAEPVRVAKPRTVSPVALGRGGPEHQYLQELIRQWGQARGFRVTIEKSLPNGGQVDVALEREGLSIACEVAVTTTLDHEIGNIEKSLTEPFDYIAVVSLKRHFLKKLETALPGKLGDAAQQRVKLFSPEELLAFLDDLPLRAIEHRVAGYNVRVRRRVADPAEMQTRKRTVGGIIARSLKRMKGTE
ncbi:MAG: type IV secretion system DNA-binding domain-containing protein [Planctomycetes bacterium]|nr:type IV secretion system DNA-binding domain-containing protein [Planctomycetota bacterium]